MQIRRTPEDEVRRRWAEHTRTDHQPEPAPPSPPVNIREVLDLGGTVYLSFRGRAYGVPPLPWPEASKLLEAWHRVAAIGALVTDEQRGAYRKGMADLARIMWANTRLVGFVPRALRRLGLIRNAFKDATEAEIAELVGFFLRSRMKATGSVRALEPHQLPTYSTTWGRSSTTSLRGWAPTGGPFLGATTSTGRAT